MSLRSLVPVTWMHKTRLRVLWIIVGVALTALGVISLTTIPSWPIVGVAVAAVALVINTLTSRLRQPICLACTHDLSGLPSGQHGTICPACGAINHPMTASATPTSPQDAGDHGSKDPHGSVSDPALDAEV